MEQNRNEMINNLLKRDYEKIEILDSILEEMSKDDNNPIKDSMGKLVLKLKELPEKEQIIFLLLEFTKELKSVIYFGKIMRDHNQIQLAEALDMFKRSDRFIPYSSGAELNVVKADVLRSCGSCRFEMEAKPRGLCFILINENSLKPQLDQMFNLFKNLEFDVIPEKMKRADQIKQIFTGIANNDKYKRSNALITITTGQIHEGMIFGYKDDKIPVIDLINIFNENECPNWRNKPKIHIFDCCRSKNISNKLPNDVLDKDWVNENINSTIIYYAAESENFQSPTVGFTYFGRALTHTFAQFACEQDLDELLTTIRTRLEIDGINEFPVVLHYKAQWSLYFNPGWPKVEK